MAIQGFSVKKKWNAKLSHSSILCNTPAAKAISLLNLYNSLLLRGFSCITYFTVAWLTTRLQIWKCCSLRHIFCHGMVSYSFLLIDVPYMVSIKSFDT